MHATKSIITTYSTLIFCLALILPTVLLVNFFNNLALANPSLHNRGASSNSQSQCLKILNKNVKAGGISVSKADFQILINKCNSSSNHIVKVTADLLKQVYAGLGDAQAKGITFVQSGS